MADPMASSTSISRTAAEDEEERDLETGQPQQASQSQPQQQEQQEEEDRVIPADEEEEEGNEEEKQDKEKDGSGSPLRGSEYDGEAISLPHEAGGGEEAAIGVAAGLCGVFDEEEDEDPLVALTREQCLAVLRKVPKKALLCFNWSIDYCTHTHVRKLARPHSNPKTHAP